MPTYDRPGNENPLDHDTLTGADDDELRRLTGIDPAAEKAMEDAAYSGAAEDMAERDGLDKLDKDGETGQTKLGAKDQEPDDSAADEETAGDDTKADAIPYRPEKRAKKRGGLTRKRMLIGGGLTGGIVSLVIGVTTLLPGFIANQLREAIMGMSDLQTRQSLKYRRSKFAKISDAFSRDGRRGGRIIADMETRGYKFRFTDPKDKNKITRLTLPNGRSTLIGEGIGQHISDYMEIRHPLRTSRWKTKRMEAFNNRYGLRGVSTVASRADDLADPEHTYNRNAAREVIGPPYDPAVTGATPAVDGEDADQKAAREARDEANRAVAKNSGTLDEIAEELVTKGTPIDKIDNELAQHLDEVDLGVSPDIHRLANKAADSKSTLNKAWAGIKALGAADVVDKLCTLMNRSRGTIIAARKARAAALLKYARSFVGISDELRKDGASPSLLKFAMGRVTAVDKNGNAIGASPGFAYALKGKFSKSKNNAFKGAYAVDGKLTGTHKGIHDAVNGIPLVNKSNCRILQNPAVQITAGAIEVGLAIFTGGGSGAVGQGAKEGAKQAIKKALQNVISKTVAKSLIKTAGKAIVVELTFEGAMALAQMYAEKTLALPVTGQEEGAELGGLLAAGGGVMNKQRSLQAGLVPATNSQYAMAHTQYLAEKAQERRQQSFFARVLDLDNPDSLAFNAALNVPQSAQQAGTMMANGASNVISSLMRGFGSLFNSVASVFGAKTFAQAEAEVSFDTYVTEGDNKGIKLATDPAGNLLPIMRRDIFDIDPKENKKALIDSGDIDPTNLEPRSNAFKDHLANCVYAIDVLSTIEWGDKNDPAEDCLAKKKETKRFKAHLAYLDMLDAVDSEFSPETIAASPQSDPTPTVSPSKIKATGLNGYTIPAKGLPTPVKRIGNLRADWSGIKDSGTIGQNSDGKPIKVYIRDAQVSTNLKTIVLLSSIHGSENGGQFVSHELLFNEQLPPDVRVIAIPEINAWGAASNLRKNKNGVDLNRNNDFRWQHLTAANETTRNGKFYKGPSPGSEPETKAVNKFLEALGRTDLVLAYHDNLNYVAPVGNTLHKLARDYGASAGMQVGNDIGQLVVSQKGSLDAWYNKQTGTPALLVEMSSNQSPQAISKHVDAVKALLVGDAL